MFTIRRRAATHVAISVGGNVSVTYSPIVHRLVASEVFVRRWTIFLIVENFVRKYSICQAFLAKDVLCFWIRSRNFWDFFSVVRKTPLILYSFDRLERKTFCFSCFRERNRSDRKTFFRQLSVTLSATRQFGQKTFGVVQQFFLMKFFLRKTWRKIWFDFAEEKKKRFVFLVRKTWKRTMRSSVCLKSPCFLFNSFCKSSSWTMICCVCHRICSKSMRRDRSSLELIKICKRWSRSVKCSGATCFCWTSVGSCLKRRNLVKVISLSVKIV